MSDSAIKYCVREGDRFSLTNDRRLVLSGLLLCYSLGTGGMKGATISKFLTYDERLEIQKGLKEQLSFGKIAAVISKDRTYKDFQAFIKNEKVVDIPGYIRYHT